MDKSADALRYELKHISHHYNGRTVLAIDHWRIPSGTVTGLAGPNGSGKTTLLKLLGFVEKPTQGEIHINGRPADPFTPGIRDTVALLPQETFLLKRSVNGNLLYGLRIRKASRKDETARVRHALALVGLDADLFGPRPWFALSGGEARRVALAARLVLQPRVLLLDEPTISVDVASAQLIKEAVLQAHREFGTTLILSSHDAPWLQSICGEIAHLFQGRLSGGGASTFFFGPWQTLDQHHVHQPLDDEQFFIARKSRLSTFEQVAAIDPAGLSVHVAPGDIPPAKARLRGIIVALHLEKKSNRIALSIAVGRILFTTYLDREALAAGGLLPGREVWVAYSPEDVQWYG